MTSRERILQLLREHIGTIQQRFTVSRIGLFGSYVRDESAPGSDIDLLVEFEEPTYDHYMDLKFFLEDLLGTEVDLVLADAVKPRLRPYISGEVVYA
jgi:hypothetical protein